MKKIEKERDNLTNNKADAVWNHDLEFDVKIVLMDEKRHEWKGVMLREDSKKPYDEAINEIMGIVKEYLLDKNIKHHKIKTLDIGLKYKDTPLDNANEEFFDYLLNQTKTKFEESDVYKKNKDNNWNYAVCETPIQKNKGVYFGLNWGGKNKNTQKKYPTKFREKGRKWPFVTKSHIYFKTFLDEEMAELNYSNLCFFRSPKAHQISEKDWDLAIALFKEYVYYINPPFTLMLGSPPKSLKQHHLTNLTTIKVKDEKHDKIVRGYTGILFGKYPFGCVPHPVARISKDARYKIWDEVVNKSVYKKAFAGELIEKTTSTE